MVRYRDLIKVEIKENKESFTIIDQAKVSFAYLKSMADMKRLLKNKIIVRTAVYQKLITAQKELQNFNPSLSLDVSYGYRSLEIQKKLFLKQLRKISQSFFFPGPQKLYEKVHQLIAVPTVAGHPTGGAVDLLIKNIKINKFLDFGSTIYDFSSGKCNTFNPNISKIAKENRLLLRRIMIKTGFAPYDGEWWHFSYGDREWAYFYKKAFAIYDQIPINKIKLLDNKKL